MKKLMPLVIFISKCNIFIKLHNESRNSYNNFTKNSFSFSNFKFLSYFSLNKRIFDLLFDLLAF